MTTSNHVVLYVLGPPGVGKTSVVRHLLSPLVTLVQRPKWTVGAWAAGTRVVAAGHYTGQTFDGGDTVPYTGARECLEYWRDTLLPTLSTAPGSFTILDGDRFSTQPSLDFIRATGEPIVGVHLTAADEYLRARRAARGSNQNEAWIRGRVTKAANFAKKIEAIDVLADGALADTVRLVNAVLRVRRVELGAA